MVGQRFRVRTAEFMNVAAWIIVAVSGGVWVIAAAVDRFTGSPEFLFFLIGVGDIMILWGIHMAWRLAHYPLVVTIAGDTVRLRRLFGSLAFGRTDIEDLYVLERALRRRREPQETAVVQIRARGGRGLFELHEAVYACARGELVSAMTEWYAQGS